MPIGMLPEEVKDDVKKIVEEEVQKHFDPCDREVITLRFTNFFTNNWCAMLSRPETFFQTTVNQSGQTGQTSKFLFKGGFTIVDNFMITNTSGFFVCFSRLVEALFDKLKPYHNQVHDHPYILEAITKKWPLIDVGVKGEVTLSVKVNKDNFAYEPVGDNLQVSFKKYRSLEEIEEFHLKLKGARTVIPPEYRPAKRGRVEDDGDGAAAAEPRPTSPLNPPLGY